MRLNPEIRRNLWLEFSLYRLLAMPIALGVIFFIGQINFNGTPLLGLAAASGWLFFLLVKIWGGHKAAEAVIEEVNDNTWDFQKLSALSPWSLAFGKLFGGTAYTWYGGMMAFAVSVFASAGESPFRGVCLNAAILLLGGLIVQATALFSSLLAVQRKAGARNRFRALPHHILGLAAGFVFAASNFSNARPGMPSPAQLFAFKDVISWHRIDWDRLDFLASTFAVILAWLIAGVCWQIKGQMKMRTAPWLWMGFVVFWVTYISGFNLAFYEVAPAMFSVQNLAAFLASFTCLYAIVFQESWNVVRYRRLAHAVRAKNYGDFLALCPRWIFTFLVSLAVAIGTSLAYPDELGAALMFALLCFAARDIAVLHLMRVSAGGRRSFLSAKFYFAAVYVLLPFSFAVLRSYQGVALFLPWPFQDDKTYVYQALMSGLLQATAALFIVFYRWHRYGRRVD